MVVCTSPFDPWMQPPQSVNDAQKSVRRNPAVKRGCEKKEEGDSEERRTARAAA